MEGHQKVTEQPLSAREKLLQEKIVRLENQLQGYKSQIGKVYLTLVGLPPRFLRLVFLLVFCFLKIVNIYKIFREVSLFYFTFHLNVLLFHS